MSELTAVGIDLGTTYSSLAIVNGQGTPEIVPNAENERLTPSAVLFDDDAIIVGQVARDANATSPDQVVLFVKRQMYSPYWHFPHGGRRYSATDISAIILRKLKQDAEKSLNRSLVSAVITVPAYFEDEGRRATITAGEQAGFKVLGLLNEPTAAAIAFGVDRSTHPEIVMVYDLGGGTFDVTIMRVEGKDIRIIGTDGDRLLGGKDFDDAIMGFAVKAFQAEHKLDPKADPTLDPIVAGELRVQAEKAKRELSKRNKTLFNFRAQGKTSRIEITREKFEELIKPKLETTLTLVRSTLQAAALQPQDIDRVLLIGGSSRIPAVARILEHFFGKEPDSSVNPDEAVAWGAALMAAHKLAEVAPEEVPERIIEKVGGLQITDVTSHSIGIEAFVPGTNRRINSILIPRNSPIPGEVSKEFITTIPGQTTIKVTVFQGEFQDPALCNPIGEFTLTGLPPGRPAGCKVRVTICCGTDGVVSVTALDIETGEQTRTEVSYRSDLDSNRATNPRDRWKSDKPIL